MSVDQKIDPFKPQAPAIPGVPAASEKREKAASRRPEAKPASGRAQGADARETRAKMIGIGVGVTIVLLAGVAFLHSSRGSSVKSSVNSFPVLTAPAPAEPAKTEPEKKLMIGPGIVATTAELEKPWSSREFLFRGPFSADPVPAMVVRLPGGQLWGFSLREPFGECELQYVTDLSALETNYGFHAEHPMVLNPCTRAIYDLARYGGGAPDGGLVRGDIVQGSAVRPPMAIEVRTSGKDIIAVRSE
ncbi:MAG TPA: hypothetical protein VHX36_16160 [Candidatus Acidoferrales bacterium]|jgi:hypothetical protein|nr:hypothetical protein [Candidatus Acidoferrales bacterium]